MNHPDYTVDAVYWAFTCSFTFSNL